MNAVLRDPHHLEIVTEVRRRREFRGAVFDRLAFAHRVLDILRPREWTIAFYQRDGDFYTNRVADPRRGANAMWATVGIPGFASREEIVLVLAQLTGKELAPYVLDLLATADDGVT